MQTLSRKDALTSLTPAAHASGDVIEACSVAMQTLSALAAQLSALKILMPSRYSVSPRNESLSAAQGVKATLKHACGRIRSGEMLSATNELRKQPSSTPLETEQSESLEGGYQPFFPAAAIS